MKQNFNDVIFQITNKLEKLYFEIYKEDMNFVCLKTSNEKGYCKLLSVRDSITHIYVLPSMRDSASQSNA